MFEVGFAELFLLGVIALLVVGPDRLPGLARTVGVWVGKAQRLVGQVRADIEREVRADELRKAAKEYSPTAVLSDMRKEVEDFAGEVSRPADLEADGNKAGSEEAAAPKAADTAGTAEPEPIEPDAGEASDPESPAGSSEGVAGTAPAAEPEPTAAHAPSPPESRRAEPPAAAEPESEEPASAAGSGPEAVKPAEGTELSNGRTENAAPPSVTEGAGTPKVERDERPAAP